MAEPEGSSQTDKAGIGDLERDGWQVGAGGDRERPGHCNAAVGGDAGQAF